MFETRKNKKRENKVKKEYICKFECWNEKTKEKE